jgi:alkanesulfonate monooxygenase SsuD/methylene tetrahydromethanopterin reductase-like flavin-dependent oxidoreductase (luciferase family)
LLLVPSISRRERVQEMLALYRDARAAAGHEGPGTVQMSYNCYLDEDGDAARHWAAVHAGHYNQRLQDAVSGWASTTSSDYKGYERLVEQVKKADFATSLQENKVLAGTPEEVLAQVRTIRDWYGEITVSLQVNSGNTPVEAAAETMRLFAGRVMPHLAG